jgi:two-component system chemotaxis response regulator CheB
MRSDGALGLAAVKDAGGLAVVQSDAEFPSMAASALQATDVDLQLPLAEMAGLIAALAPQATEQPREEIRMEPVGDDARHSPSEGDASGLTCPDCGGAVWFDDGEGPRAAFRCHVGHVYSLQAMVDGQGEAVERALWSAVAVLEERCGLLTGSASTISVSAVTPPDEAPTTTMSRGSVATPSTSASGLEAFNARDLAIWD